MSRKPNRLRKAGRAAFLGALVGAGPVGVLMWRLAEKDAACGSGRGPLAEVFVVFVGVS